MHRVALTVLSVAVTSAALGLPKADARLIENWSYERLFREADLAVIARPVSIAQTGEITRDNLWKAEFVGVTTTFEVLARLKGRPAGKRLRVFHYRLRAGVRIVSGPLLVSFRLRSLTVRTGGGKFGLGRPDYLLFLKKRKDGRYECVSGQIDPYLAVREIFAPLPKELGRGKRD